MSGVQTLEASASDSASPISNVKFVLTGGSLDDTVVATGASTKTGWLANWQSGDVPNGAYTLQSVVTDAAGNVAYSAGVTIDIENSVSTDVLVPSADSSIMTGSKVVIDAGASDAVGVTKVQFTLNGGSLNHSIIATATNTEDGWIASWNSTTVPDGTYSLQSVANDAAGNQGTSPGVTVIVENKPPVPKVTVPSNGSAASGAVILGSAAPTDVGVTQVQFYLTGGSFDHALIATGGLGTYGWLAGWAEHDSARRDLHPAERGDGRGRPPSL